MSSFQDFRTIRVVWATQVVFYSQDGFNILLFLFTWCQVVRSIEFNQVSRIFVFNILQLPLHSKHLLNSLNIILALISFGSPLLAQLTIQVVITFLQRPFSTLKHFCCWGVSTRCHDHRMLHRIAFHVTRFRLGNWLPFHKRWAYRPANRVSFLRWVPWLHILFIVRRKKSSIILGVRLDLTHLGEIKHGRVLLMLRLLS